MLPITIAANVLISSRPLARDSAASGSTSGTMPYFAGLKKVACAAIRKSTTRSRLRRPPPIVSAANASAIDTISSALVATSTVRLS